MNQRFEPIEYPADLSREEYIRSQEILNKPGGSRLVTTVLVLCCLSMAAPWVYRDGQADWSLISLLVMMIACELWTMLTVRQQLRDRAGEAYDSTVYSGYSFVGVVTVEEDAIRKRTATATAVIPFEACRLYVETPEMLIFCKHDGKSIVLPARFLTAETAARTREIAFAQIPPQRRMLLGELQPATEQTLAAVQLDQPEAQELMTVHVEYADNELVSLTTDLALQVFADSLPTRCLLMTLVAALGYFVFELMPIPVCSVGLLALFLFSVIRARIKMRRAITRTERDVCRIRVEFTDRYVALIGKADGMRPLRLPWSHITRAVDCRDTVELYTGKVRQLSIPKRCIGDFDVLCKIVDGQMAQTRS